jgi:hypothetical protein
MSVKAGPQVRMPVFCKILLVLAFICWLMVIPGALSLRLSDAAGNAINSAFMFLFAIAQWGMLALVVLTALLKMDMPLWAKTSVAILVLFSCAASFATLNTLASDDNAGRWLLGIPIVIPPLIAFYVIWFFVPRLHSVVPLNTAGVVVCGFLAILSILPIPSVVRHEIAEAEMRAEWARKARIEYEDRASKEREEWRAKFRVLPPGAPLWEWRPFTEHGEELRLKALEGIRRLASRQADAEQLLELGLNFPMLYMAQMNLELTPALCERARKFLRGRLASISPPVPGRPYSWEKDSVDPYLSSMEWLLLHGCACSPEVAQIETAVRAYPGAQDRDRTLSVLERMRKETGKP